MWCGVVWCGVVWCGVVCVCITERGAFEMQIRIDGVDRGKKVCDGTTVPIKMRGVRIVVC